MDVGIKRKWVQLYRVKQAPKGEKPTARQRSGALSQPGQEAREHSKEGGCQPSVALSPPYHLCSSFCLSPPGFSQTVNWPESCRARPRQGSSLFLGCYSITHQHTELIHPSVSWCLGADTSLVPDAGNSKTLGKAAAAAACHSSHLHFGRWLRGKLSGVGQPLFSSVRGARMCRTKVLKCSL